MKKFACIFPGQGSQSVGMAEPLFADSLSTEILNGANDALGFDLLGLMKNGPIEELTLTANAQPAILTTSVALWKLLERALEGVVPAFVAGHSLGEFSALASSGAIKPFDAVKLVRKRGEFMQNAVPAGQGAMAALIGGTDEKASELIRDVAEGDILDIANFNSPGQIVISGSASAIDRAANAAKDYGFKRAIPLQVSAPFHSRLMEPVRKLFTVELSKYEFSKPICPIIHNVNALPNDDPGLIPDFLARQIDSPVLWTDSILKMISEEVEVFIEVGSGNVLQGLVKKISGGENVENITGCSSPADVDKIIEALKG
ncbi:MAG: ACP S-malonyltransferase [bacterium]